MSKKQRGFEEVIEASRAHGKEVEAHGQRILLHPKTTLPTRADVGSAGYDFYSPVDVQILPGATHLLWTNVKAYMQEGEVLHLYPRSSVAKEGLVLANTVGIIDASYYNNPTNNGNIGILLRNTSGRAYQINAGQKIAQGIFLPYLVADEDVVQKTERTGGIGSSGK